SVICVAVVDHHFLPGSFCSIDAAGVIPIVGESILAGGSRGEVNNPFQWTVRSKLICDPQDSRIMPGDNIHCSHNKSSCGIRTRNPEVTGDRDKSDPTGAYLNFDTPK